MGKYWDKIIDLLLIRSQQQRRLSRRKQQEDPLETIPRSMVFRYIEANSKAIPPHTSHETVTATIATAPRPTTESLTPRIGHTSIKTQQKQMTLPILETNDAYQACPSPPTSPTYANHKVALPRYTREDRSCLSLYPVVENEGATKLNENSVMSANRTSIAPHYQPTQARPPYAGHRRTKSAPLLYEVPQLSQTHGIGKYRVSVNASSDFVDAITRSRTDSFSDLLVITVADVANGRDGEDTTPTKSSRYTGNMDTTSPPPPKRAFSRGNSPVRLAIYGKDADNVVEEELHEQDGKLIFGIRKHKGQSFFSESRETTGAGGPSPEEEEKEETFNKNPDFNDRVELGHATESSRKVALPVEKQKQHKRHLIRSGRALNRSKQARLEIRTQEVINSKRPVFEEKLSVLDIKPGSGLAEVDVLENESKELFARDTEDIATTKLTEKLDKGMKTHVRRVRPALVTRRATARR